MKKKIKVMPNPERKVKVRDPLTREFLPKEGKDVVLDSYWSRRIKDGDLVKVESKASPKKEASFPKELESKNEDQKKNFKK